MSRRIILIGGGYGGMYLLRTLFERLPEDVEITLVDRLPKSPLKTEFYSLSAGTTSLQDVTLSFPSHPQLNVVFDEVLAVDQLQKQITLREQGILAYDTLVFALGCVDHYHDVPGAEQYAYGLQSLKRAQVTGQAILTLDAYRSVVLIGAGLTGIELTAELRESRPDLQVTLIDRNERVLSGFSPKLQEYVENWLTKHDVKIMHHMQTKAIHEGYIEWEDGELAYDRLVWTAGIQANPLVRSLHCETDSIGRAVVNEWMQLVDDPSVFVIGDSAASGHAPSAQLAEFHGEYVAHIVLAQWSGRQLPARVYQNRGALGSLGKTAGFGSIKGMDLEGKIPRMLKSGVLWNYKKHVEK